MIFRLSCGGSWPYPTRDCPTPTRLPLPDQRGRPAVEKRNVRNNGVSLPGAHGNRLPPVPEGESDGFPGFLLLPTDRPRSAAMGDVAWESRAMPSELAREVGQLPGSAEDKLPTLLAAFTVLLHRYSSDTQIVVGIPLGMAEHGRAGRLAGSIPRVQPLWIDLSGDPEFRDVEARVRQQWCDAMALRRSALSVAPQNDS